MFTSGIAWPRRALGVLAAFAAVVTLMAGPASAEVYQECTGATKSNVCLTITDLGSGVVRVDIGIDYHISLEDARAILAPPGDPFMAKMFGDDPSFDNFLFWVDLDPAQLGASAENGLSAGFSRTVPRSWLNEDWEGRDEVYGQVVLEDPRTGTIQRFNSPVISLNA
ncbi:hypothetical protein MF672_015680 [Actinomadura sp. ATCC 31491]|uniref:Uncharacterized protein n=1 Tax=Actinomadura luzonensis TaxID=2805427 RepID=A0ABT0FSA2_9ACTN|nr:hypothetical protein [Actinomadura luzonensis]MCK2215216.1 hypothetical protein [Actinomadura luzonensis]